jgi:hypothetical protein
MADDINPYQALQAKYPRLAARLVEAEQQRRSRLVTLLDGARFRGLDELLRHLDGVARAFHADTSLGELAVLITRACADFETALEATLSGYFSVAADAMRDVMEIEMLLLDFSLAPARISRWLQAPPQERRREFAPGELRSRLRAGGIEPYASRTADPDYRAHSEALHVSPYTHPIFRKGMSSEREGDFLTQDGGFWEQYEHARRLLLAIERLRHTAAASALEGVGRVEELSAFGDGWERTQQMQTLYLALIQAAQDNVNDADD